MVETGAGLRVRCRVLLVLLVCIAPPLVGGCSSEPECIFVFFLPECFEDDDDDEKKDDTAMQTSVRVNAGADDIDTSMAALRQTLAGADAGMQAVVHRHLDETSLNLDLLRHEVVHRNDGFHLRVEVLNRAIRSSLEAIRAEVDRLDADMRNTVASHLDAIGAITLLNDEHMRTDCRLTLGDESCGRLGT